MDKEDAVRTNIGKLVSHQKNEMSSAATWIDPEVITLSEENQEDKEKDKCHATSLTCET